MKHYKRSILSLLLLPSLIFAINTPDCKEYVEQEIAGFKVNTCYAKNYNNYSVDDAVNEFLQDQVYVEGGEFKNIKTGQTIKMQGFYMDKYLTPFQEYNAYLRDNNLWDEGRLSNDKKTYPRLTREKYNGLYPARADYYNAIDFCHWLGKKTGLDISLPTYSQWMYAATSRGTNWQYPTDNGQLNIGENYYQYSEEDKKNHMISTLVNEPPVNSLGIYQFFGNGSQMTKASSDKRVTAVGTPMTWPEKIVKDTKLSSGGYTITAPISETTGFVGSVFRCVINTDKPIPRHLD